MTVNLTHPFSRFCNGPPHIVYQWKRFLHREFIEEIKKIYVCLKHFRDEDILEILSQILHNRLSNLCKNKLVRLQGPTSQDPKLARPGMPPQLPGRTPNQFLTTRNTGNLQNVHFFLLHTQFHPKSQEVTSL